MITELKSAEEEKIILANEIPTGSENILVVDDETLVVTMEKTILEGLGYAVYAETDSVKALGVVTADPGRFDLIVTDQKMPILGGVDFSRQVYALNPDLPVVLCSGDVNLVDVDAFFQAGNRKILQKPMTAMALASAVRTLLDAR